MRLICERLPVNQNLVAKGKRIVEKYVKKDPCRHQLGRQRPFDHESVLRS